MFVELFITIYVLATLASALIQPGKIGLRIPYGESERAVGFLVNILIVLIWTIIYIYYFTPANIYENAFILWIIALNLFQACSGLKGYPDNVCVTSFKRAILNEIIDVVTLLGFAIIYLK